MESMDIPLKPINIKTLIESACKDIRSRFQNKDLKISIEITRGPYTVKGGDLLLDVFENILINGCIHNDAETIQLWIKASKIRKHGEKFIKIEFKDNGIGIKEERKESIFKRGFKKEKSRGGMGLGLSLAKRIIRKYGGQIRVENRIKGDPTQGSNFIILIEEAKRG
jgi:two-component system phosphate regulon sensor histidine kinase PhoR